MNRSEINNTASDDFASLVPPVWRASTVVFKTLDDFVARKTRLPDGFTYGTTGTPTQRALERRIAAIDAATHCIVFPSGQAAICSTLLTFLRQGDHLLITEAAYGPAKTFALRRLASLGIEVELYNPRIGSGIDSLIKPNTKLIWLESPGTVTMEVQDIPAIAAVAKVRGVLTAIDNTWASPSGFPALSHGLDLCVHACTKYMSGHSDVLMGSVSTMQEPLYRQLRDLQATMGLAVSAEDCFLVQRGLDTLGVRLQHQSASAVAVAEHLSKHAAVKQVLFPPLELSPDYMLWKRDFSMAGCVMSVQLTDAPFEAYRALFEQFRVFSIGASWGSVHSIAAFYPKEEFQDRRFGDVRGPIVRLSIGLESLQVLTEELDRALNAFESFVRSDEKTSFSQANKGNHAAIIL